MQDILNVEDFDTFFDGVWYVVIKFTNGRILFLNNIFKDITRFIQQSINIGQVVFVYEGMILIFYFYFFILLGLVVKGFLFK